MGATISEQLAVGRERAKCLFPAALLVYSCSLGKLLGELRSADLVPHDYWTVVVKTDPEGGRFEAWSSGEGKIVALGADRNGGPKTKSFVMGNYFGLGYANNRTVSTEKATYLVSASRHSHMRSNGSFVIQPVWVPM